MLKLAKVASVFNLVLPEFVQILLQQLFSFLRRLCSPSKIIKNLKFKMTHFGQTRIEFVKKNQFLTKLEDRNSFRTKSNHFKASIESFSIRTVQFMYALCQIIFISHDLFLLYCNVSDKMFLFSKFKFVGANNRNMPDGVLNRFHYAL